MGATVTNLKVKLLLSWQLGIKYCGNSEKFCRAYLNAANQETAHVLENFVTVKQVQVVQLVQFDLEFERARIQRHSVRLEAVDVVLRWKVTLQQCSTQYNELVKIVIRLTKHSQDCCTDLIGLPLKPCHQ